jgi:hypothetical protein
VALAAAGALALLAAVAVTRTAAGVTALRGIAVLPSGVDPRRQPAARAVQETLRSLTHDAAEKLAGKNLHRHERKLAPVKQPVAPVRAAARLSHLDPDALERRARKFDSFERGQVPVAHPCMHARPTPPAPIASP